MNYKQLTINERHTIDILFNIKKESIASIAYFLNRSKLTIYREIKRNSINGVYTFEIDESKKVKRSRHKYFFRKMKYQEFALLFKKYYDPKYRGVKTT